MKPIRFIVLFLLIVPLAALTACAGGAGTPAAEPTSGAQPTTAAVATTVPTTAAVATAAPTTAAVATTAPTTAAPATTAPTTAAATQAPTSAATTAPTATPLPTATATLLPGRSAQTLLGWSSSDAENNLLNQIVTNYNNSQNKYEAYFNPVPNYDQSLQTALAGGAPPDAFYLDSLKVPDFTKNNVLAAPPANGIQDPNDFYPSLKAAFTANGTFYCPPKDFSTLGLIYNKKMLDAAGVKVPTTWDELRAAAQKLTDKSKSVYGMSLSPDAARWVAFLYQAGGHILNDQGKMDINTPQAKQAMDYYTGLLTDGFAVTPDKVNAGWNGEAFGKQQVAMVVEGNWMVPFLKQSYPDVSYGVAELPAGPSGKATLAFTVCYAVAKNAKTPDASWGLVNYLTSKDGMQAWTDLGLAMPTRQSLRDHWVQKFPDLQPFLAGAAYAHAWQFAPGFTTVTDAIGNGITKITSGQATSTQILQLVQQTGQQVLSGP